MKTLSLVFVALLAALPLAGCLGADETPPVAPTYDDTPPLLGYMPPEPDLSLDLIQEDVLLAGEGGTEIHVRLVRPSGEGPFPVIAQFTPYTAPGQSVAANGLIEPTVGCTFIGTPSVPMVGSVGVGSVGCEGGFDYQFVRRGYVFAYGDVRGTGDSSGCLDLRGKLDIADLYHLTEWLGTQPWSNGNVGFIGASYPGSEAHMAALAGNEHLKAVVPVVASTSFYHYHHNDGVPYAGQHSLGGTNTGYTQNAVMPTVNPQSANYATRYAEETQCPTHENVLYHGGLDQTGSYYDWWQERNLRPMAATVKVPVLMAQGLADWNVKPDHIASWFNDLSVPKTLIAGQWHHAYPFSACVDDQNPATCDDRVPYGDWWHYVNAFFDTYLKEIDTGMFQGSVAWVQDSTGTWHRSNDWPLLPERREEMVLNLMPDGSLNATAPAEAKEFSWYGCADDQYNMGQGQLATIESNVAPCDAGSANEQLVFVSDPFASDAVVSGVPLLELTLESERTFTHLVVLVEVLDADGNVVDREVRKDYDLGVRENYGYLNPTYRNGIDAPEPVPTGTSYTATVDMYPQEDVVKAGERLRVTVKSDDSGRTIEAFESGTNTLLLGPDNVNRLVLPLRPLDLQGTRLPEPVATSAAE